jgi:hypothetical protein
MAWNGSDIQALSERRKARLKATVQQSQQDTEGQVEQGPSSLRINSLTEEERACIYEEEKRKREAEQQQTLAKETQGSQIGLLGMVLGCAGAWMWYQIAGGLGAIIGFLGGIRVAGVWVNAKKPFATGRASPTATATPSRIVRFGEGFIVLCFVILGIYGVLTKEQRQQASEARARQEVAQKAAQEQEQKVLRERARQQTEHKRQAEEVTCRKNVECWGDHNLATASAYCKAPIEKLARYSVEWTNGWLELKFSRFRWRDESRGVVTYIGDKIKFQNGFGAWQPHTYECDFDTSTNTVLNVRSNPGQLP